MPLLPLQAFRFRFIEHPFELKSVISGCSGSVAKGATMWRGLMNMMSVNMK